MRDLYTVLQIDPKAEHEVVRAAFRALARKYHPDSGGDRDRMIAIVEAWSILGDVRRRANYDRGLAGLVRPMAPSTTGSKPATAGPTAPLATTPAPASGPIAAAAPDRSPAEAAGHPPPPDRGRSDGSTLDFGRYAGWSIGQLARHDPNYLEWLRRTPIGRPFSAEIESTLERGASVAVATPPAPRSWRQRRSA
ncbi:MAG TPA: DnaJ domain-containing protein [Candidatus Acidoferrum sp.]|nr:DnaJ domain-containing protein [Candidatus Acidoferrum sp.]